MRQLEGKQGLLKLIHGRPPGEAEEEAKGKAFGRASHGRTIIVQAMIEAAVLDRLRAMRRPSRARHPSAP
jgi:hypothetical protein